MGHHDIQLTDILGIPRLESNIKVSQKFKHSLFLSFDVPAHLQAEMPVC